MTTISTRNPPRAPKPERSLAAVRPDLAASWHSVDNGAVTPLDVSPGMDWEAWWSCPACGHAWRARVKRRSQGTGCPACAGTVVVPGVNDLASQRPDIAEEWDTATNGSDTPAGEFVSGHTRRNWRCRSCDHRWPTTAASRTQGSGCPNCAGKVLVPGVNDFATHYPELAATWHPTDNDVRPDEVFPHGKRKYWWLCETCGERYGKSTAHRIAGAACTSCAA